MNLYCNKVELIQTPTYITYMCTAPFDDSLSDVDFAVAALKQYLIWIRYGISYDVPNGTKKQYTDHITAVQALINNPPENLEVHIV
jgi:hypothetical protein